MPLSVARSSPDLGLKPGDHVCAFFLGQEERDAVMLPFLAKGLEAGDKCICCVHTSTPDAVLASLGDADDVNGFVACKQLDVQSVAETSLPGGHLSMDAMLDCFETFAACATADGSVARLTGEGAWALDGHASSEQLLDYESELNRMVTRHRQIILCLYDLAVFGGGIVVDLLKTHPKILVGGMLTDNPQYRG